MFSWTLKVRLNSPARETSMNDSQCSHELWRCGSIALLEKPLWMIVYILMNSEGAIESMLFHESSRDETSSHDNIIILNCILSFFYLNLTQILFKSDSDISFKSDSDVIQMYFNSLCIIMLKCISFRFIFQILSRSDSDILLKSDSNVIQIYFSFIYASLH